MFYDCSTVAVFRGSAFAGLLGQYESDGFALLREKNNFDSFRTGGGTVHVTSKKVSTEISFDGAPSVSYQIAVKFKYSEAEGMNAPPSVISASGVHVDNSAVFMTDNPDPALKTAPGLPGVDQTVGDVDDILAFTTKAREGTPFRGLVNGQLMESNDAEVIWFVRGNTLYRRVLLVDDGGLNLADDSIPAAGFYQNNDLSVRRSVANAIPNTLQSLKFRENRFGHYANLATKRDEFPYPLYRDTFENWYYLRMPTLEETTHNDWSVAGQLPVPNITAPTTAPYWDLWNNPNHWANSHRTLGQFNATGSLNAYVADDPDDNTKKRPHIRAGEDVVLTNVISFDVKVWNPVSVPLVGGGEAPPQYVNLGQSQFLDENGVLRDVDYATDPTANFGFCTTGKYGGRERFTFGANGDDEPVTNTSALNAAGRQLMPCVYDSWTIEYESHPDRYKATTGAPDEARTGYGLAGLHADFPRTDSANWECPPPYDEELESIEITIRCFEPRSKLIRQVRIVQSF